MKINKTRIGIILGILIVLAAVWLFLLRPAPRAGSYDFIRNFDKSERTGFFGAEQLLYAMPDNKIMLKGNKLGKALAQVYRLPFRTVFPAAARQGGAADFPADGVYRVVIAGAAKDKGFLNFELASPGTDKRVRFNFSGSVAQRVDISEFSGSSSMAIATLNLRPDKDSKSVLNILAMGGRIIVFDPDEVLMIWNRYGDERFKMTQPETGGGINCSVKFAPLPQDIAKNITGRLPGLFQGKQKSIYISSNKWNGLYPEHILPGVADADGYLQRIKIGEDVMPAVIIPSGGKIRYEVRIPKGGRLEFHLALPPRKNSSPEKRSFMVNVYSSGSRLLKRFDIDAVNSGRVFKAFVPVKLDLADIAKKKVIIEFEYKNGGNPGVPDFIALADPMLYPSDAGDKPNIILISLDTLRSDHLGIYGYGRGTSPNIDKFAKESTVFLNAVSCSPWTLPSHMSFMTSLYPFETGLRPSGTWYADSRLAPSVKTLAQYMKEAGYKTAGITGGSYLSAVYGYDRGFDFYREHTHYKEKDSNVEIAQAIDWIKANRADRFFLFFHTYEIHEPYTRDYFCRLENIRENGGGIRPYVIAKYDSGIRHADESVGRLIDELRRMGLLFKTVVIITSDHGENFDLLKKGRSGTWGSHGQTLYDAELKVPLIIGGCKKFQTGKRIMNQVSLVDLLPSIVDMAGEEAGEGIRGRSFLPLISGDRGAGAYAYAEGIFRAKYDKKALRTNGFKFIYDTAPADGAESAEAKYEYYDLGKDPHEKTNIARDNIRRVEALNAQLRKIMSSILANYTKLTSGKTGPAADTKDLQEQLKNLGYIGN